MSEEYDIRSSSRCVCEMIRFLCNLCICLGVYLLYHVFPAALAHQKFQVGTYIAFLLVIFFYNLTNLVVLW
jgi:hypothetical protein